MLDILLSYNSGFGEFLLLVGFVVGVKIWESRKGKKGNVLVKGSMGYELKKDRDRKR